MSLSGIIMLLSPDLIVLYGIRLTKKNAVFMSYITVKWCPHWHSSSLSPGLDTVHTAGILCFPLYHCGQSRGQQAIGHGDLSLSPPRDRQQGSVAVIHSDRLSYGCIYKTYFSPIMLVSISMCVFSMLLKYRTLYSKSKMSLNREKLLTNDFDMSTIFFIM